MREEKVARSGNDWTTHRNIERKKRREETLTRSDVVSNQLMSIEEICSSSVGNSVSVEEGGGSDLKQREEKIRAVSTKREREGNQEGREERENTNDEDS